MINARVVVLGLVVRPLGWPWSVWSFVVGFVSFLLLLFFFCVWARCSLTYLSVTVTFLMRYALSVFSIFLIELASTSSPFYLKDITTSGCLGSWDEWDAGVPYCKCKIYIHQELMWGLYTDSLALVVVPITKFWCLFFSWKMFLKIIISRTI
jgi:hypothetical protein